MNFESPNFTPVTIRPATVCGYSPRQRLDVVVNILTNLAFHKREISVYGGNQLRPNIHIDDMADAYIAVIEADAARISGQIFNVGTENQTVLELAETVRSVVGMDVRLVTSPSSDNRSYHISSKKIADMLGFVPSRSIARASSDIKRALEAGLLPNSLTDERFFNIKRMQSLKLI